MPNLVNVKEVLYKIDYKNTLNLFKFNVVIPE